MCIRSHLIKHLQKNKTIDTSKRLISLLAYVYLSNHQEHKEMVFIDLQSEDKLLN